MMKKKMFSLNKYSKLIRISLIYLLLFVICLLLFSGFITISGSSYIPRAPIGPTSGTINIGLEFSIITSEAGSIWMFDWDDGTYSDWIEVQEGEESISESHIWVSYGVYEVRVKRKNIYDIESFWSDSLTVNLYMPPDLDKDGYLNELEEAYGSDYNDPNDYPLDTDKDGTPDDDSFDSIYLGDFDDDGDGFSDSDEIILGSDSKDGTDVITIFISTSTYYLVDINQDGISDIFYRSQTGLKTDIEVVDGMFLIDTNGNGFADHYYKNGIVNVYDPALDIPWLLVIAIIIFVILLIVFILYKKGYIYFYEEEYVVEE